MELYFLFIKLFSFYSMAFRHENLFIITLEEHKLFRVFISFKIEFLKFSRRSGMYFIRVETDCKINIFFNIYAIN